MRTAQSVFLPLAFGFCFDPTDNNALLGTSVTVTNVTIDKNGLTGSRTFTNTLFDPSGKPEGTFSGEAEVTRVVLVP